MQDTLMSQYANSPAICALINGMNDMIDPNYSVNSFYNLVWNVSTANSLGLDVWGRIVGADRNAKIIPPDAAVFGFETDPQSFQPLDQAPFRGSDANFASYRLNDSDYRKVIMLKAAANLIYATAPNINRFMQAIFGKRCYYLLTGTMKAAYYFEFKLDFFERYLVYTLGILPVPCGVEVEYFEKETWTNFIELIVNSDMPKTLGN